MQRKIILFVCAVLCTVLAISVVTGVQKRSEMNLKQSKVEPTVKKFIEIMDNAANPEYKSMYWELLSQKSKDVLIQKKGSLEGAQTSVWIMLQEFVDSQRYIEYVSIDYKDIKGDIATVVIRVKISEGGKEPAETTILHKYRWENDEWKFIDWLLEPEMYKG